MRSAPMSKPSKSSLGFALSLPPSLSLTRLLLQCSICILCLVHTYSFVNAPLPLSRFLSLLLIPSALSFVICLSFLIVPLYLVFAFLSIRLDVPVNDISFSFPSSRLNAYPLSLRSLCYFRFPAPLLLTMLDCACSLEALFPCLLPSSPTPSPSPTCHSPLATRLCRSLLWAADCLLFLMVFFFLLLFSFAPSRSEDCTCDRPATAGDFDLLYRWVLLLCLPFVSLVPLLLPPFTLSLSADQTGVSFPCESPVLSLPIQPADGSDLRCRLRQAFSRSLSSLS
ncbi:uncharacterized protein BJ171DRAFT_196464 [Polychytrium aggregatum]|uniref:uncharacterized protein n=1 Tax=Polychytrium aggregatum TaxID=110093 RepID=UPI0022FE3E26|nr:uncharacterized protein BJ171DRAFT_196464 [Polychytrium aggregatum]KAI9201841.1 hypothetical protein BJ171DRAFT_196464 [Polychytrium aggregatum]